MAEPRDSSEERAKLAQLEAWEKMAVWFDGGPELLSHEQMHRHHKTEPYIGCLFCRDKFMPVSEYEEMRALVGSMWLYMRGQGEIHLTTEQRELLYDVLDATADPHDAPLVRWWRDADPAGQKERNPDG